MAALDCECELGVISVTYLSRDAKIDYWICIFDEIAGHRVESEACRGRVQEIVGKKERKDNVRHTPSVIEYEAKKKLN